MLNRSKAAQPLDPNTEEDAENVRLFVEVFFVND